MNIIEFKKRWMMHYINPVYFYLPFEQCEGEEEDDLYFFIRIKLYNTYNPITGEFYNTKNKKGRQLNQSCDYYKILVTYLGENEKGKEELVYCSFRGKYNNKMYYDTNDKEINQMADGSPLKYGKYRVKIWGTYGLGAPGKTWTFNLKESNNGKTFVLYVNWHLVKLQTKLGSPAQTWSTSIQGPRYVLSEHSASWAAHGIQEPLYVKARISASGSLTSQTLTDLVLKDVLCTVPYKADPRSYYRPEDKGTACSVAASRPMYNISEDFEEYKLYTYTESVFATFYQYYVNKYKTHITPEDVNNCYKLTTLKNLSDYAKIPNPCPATGNQGAITTDDIPTEVSPSFSSWHIADLSYGSGSHNLRLYQNKSQLDRKTNSWPLISQIQIDITQWRHAGQYGYQDYGETFWAVNGYCYPENYANAEAYVPVGANFSSAIDGITYYNSDNHSYYYKYESDNIIHFSSNKPTGDDISNIQPFEVYDRSSFSFGYKQGHYTKSWLQKVLPDVYNYKPWQKEVPSDRFKIEMDESQGVTNYGVSNPMLFYLYDEQSWSSCCCYALFRAIPTIESVPNLSKFNKK